MDFKSTVLIMTSTSPMRPSPPRARRPRSIDGLRSELLQYFKPEFVNRLDDVVRFHPLIREQSAKSSTCRSPGDRPRRRARSCSVTLTDDARQLLGNRARTTSAPARCVA